MKRRHTIVVAMLLAGTTLVGCNTDGGDAGAPEARQDGEAEASPQRIDIAALDYSFEVPDTIDSGLVQFDFVNRGQEPHFFGLAKIAEGHTLEEVMAALTGPPPPPGVAPAAPPPFEDWGGIATSDPGVSGEVAFDIPAGGYVFYCLVPSPDGESHAAKGMVKEITVTESTGAAASLPEAEEVMVATDFAFNRAPTLTEGSNEFRIRNDGRQLHEINLFEIAADQTIEDVVEWHGEMAGPPPGRFLGGVAVAPGEEGSTTLDIAPGRTYVFICAIPDVLGDFAPHVTKGMHTEALSVS